MRGIVVTLVIFSTIPFVLMRPYIGLLVYSWVSFMSPHRLAPGTFAYDFPFAMLIGVLLIISWLISREPKSLPMTPVTVLMLLLAFWYCVTTYFAIDGVRPVWGIYPRHEWARAEKVMLIAFLTLILLTDRKRIEGYIWLMVVSIGFYAVKGGLYTLVGGGRYWVHGPPGSMIAENNALGVATIMVVPLVRYLQLQATHKHVRRGLTALVPIMILSAFGSQSRGALLAIAAMGAFLLMKSRHKLAVGLSGVVLLIGILSFLPQKWYDRMETIQDYQEDTSAMGRINAWTAAINLALDRPLVGGGFRVFIAVPIVWEKYAPDPNHRAVAHSIYFQTLGQHGFPGLFFFLGVLFLAFRNGSWLIRSARDRPDLLWARDLGAMLQVSLIGYAVGAAFLSLANYDLYWGIVVISVTARLIVAKQLAAPAKTPPADAAMALTAAAPAAEPRKSFLRAPGDTTNLGSFRRG